MMRSLQAWSERAHASRRPPAGIGPHAVRGGPEGGPTPSP